jgi:Spy/CpxP family protein refolding chaperone
MKRFTQVILFAILAMTLATTSAVAQGKPGAGPGHHEMDMGVDRELMQAVIPPRMVLRHSEAIGLSEAQRQRVEGLIENFEQQNEGLREELRREAQTLRGLLEATPVDTRAALRQADRVMLLEIRLKRARLEMMIETRNLLTAEQLDGLEELRKERRPGRRGGERGEAQKGPQRRR